MNCMAQIADAQAEVEQLGVAVHQMVLDKAGHLAREAELIGEPISRLRIATHIQIQRNPSKYNVTLSHRVVACLLTQVFSTSPGQVCLRLRTLQHLAKT